MEGLDIKPFFCYNTSSFLEKKMPIYEYKCRSCGSVVEVIQKVNERPLDTCDQCGGALVKLISSPAIQFKGPGWYVTDYAQKTKAPKTKDAESKPKEQKIKDKKETKETKKVQPPSPAI
jgi:putative FmdB family regulatory protein